MKGRNGWRVWSRCLICTLGIRFWFRWAVDGVGGADVCRWSCRSRWCDQGLEESQSIFTSNVNWIVL